VQHCCTWETLKFQAECRTSVLSTKRPPESSHSCDENAFNIVAVLVSRNMSLARPRTWLVKAKDFCSRPRLWPSTPMPKTWPSRPRTQNLSLRTRQSQGPKPRTTTLHLAVVVSGRFRGGLDAFLRAKAVTALARLSHRNSVCPSVTRVDQSKKVQARITKSSPSAACLKDSKVSGTVKIFHKFEGRHSERGR